MNSVPARSPVGVLRPLPPQPRAPRPGRLRVPARLQPRRLPAARLPRARGGSLGAGRGAHRVRQDDRRRVRRAPRPGEWPQGVLHDPDQGAVEPEVQRPRQAVRRRQGRPAHRRQQHQRRGAGGRDDHRGAPQHAVRRFPHPRGTRLRGDGRGALPRRPDARRRLGGGHHPPPRVGGAGLALGHGEQRRGVRRVARHRARRDHHDRRGAPAGAALPARRGGPADVRPVRRRDRHRPRRARGRPPGAPGEPRAGPRRPRRLGSRPDEGPPARPREQATQQGPWQHPCRVDAEPQRRGRAARPCRAAAGHRVHLQPGRVRRRSAAVPEREPPADLCRGARRDRRVRAGALLQHPRRGPAGARLPRVPRRAQPRDRRPPRRDAAQLQGVRRGAVPPRPVPGGVRHRDAGARHQHARALGGDREAVEVERRDPRRHHAGGVHPAHRARRPTRHRRRGSRRRPVAAGLRPQGRRRSRLDADLSAQVVVPPVVQHGGQPGAPVRSRARARAAGVVLRPVPGRQGRRRARPAAAQERGRARGVRRGRELSSRRLHGVRRAAAPALRHREEPLEVAALRPAPGGHRLAGVAATRRRDRGPQRSLRRDGRRARPGHPCATGKARGPTCSPPTSTPAG